MNSNIATAPQSVHAKRGQEIRILYTVIALVNAPSSLLCHHSAKRLRPNFIYSSFLPAG